MDIRPNIALIILGCALVTALPRIVPMVVLSRLAIPKWLTDWLSFIPITIMVAIVAQEVLLPSGTPDPGRSTVLLGVSLVTLVVAVATRSLFITVLAGASLMLGAQWWGWS